MQSSVTAFFSWKLEENKDSKFDDNFNTSNMTWTGHYSPDPTNSKFADPEFSPVFNPTDYFFHRVIISKTFIDDLQCDSV